MNEDLATLFEKLNINKENISPDMLNSLNDMLNNNPNSSSNNDNTSNGANPDIDFETILRMKSIMDNLRNADDPRANLLLSLKPYLKNSRKEKLDQYIQLLKVSKVLEDLQVFGGDNRNENKQ